MRIARERLATNTTSVEIDGKVSRPGVIPGPTVIVRMKRERD
jgi:hypothetical protein